VSFFEHDIFCVKDLGISQISPLFFMLENPVWFQNEERSLLYNFTEPDFSFFSWILCKYQQSYEFYHILSIFYHIQSLKTEFRRKEKQIWLCQVVEQASFFILKPSRAFQHEK